MSSKILAVIRREFVTRVHTKTFIITTLLLPLVILVLAVLPSLMMGGAGHTERVAVVDGTSGRLGHMVEQVLSREKLDEEVGDKPRYTVKRVPAVGKVDAVRKQLIARAGYSGSSEKGDYDGVLVLPEGVLESGKLTYYGSNASSPAAMSRLSSSLSKAFAGTRLAKDGIDMTVVAKAMRPVELDSTKLSDGKLTGQSGKGAFFVAYGMGFLLYMAIMLFGQQTMVSVVEEKTSRVVEVLVSSLTPFEMLLGKVVGVASVGLLQMAIWGLSAWFITSQAGHLAALVGADPAAMASFALPHIAVGLVLMFLLYFVLGFLLYGALYAAIGSMCSAIQDSQQYASIVTMLIVVGFLVVFAVIPQPDGTLAHVMSWIPFFAPFAMPVRWALTSVSPLELAGSLAMMVLGTLFCVWLAARIYHTGILMFGKKPGWAEVWRWIRTR